MRVAVTGATGFIGRHLLQRLDCEPGLTIIAAGRRRERWNEIGQFVEMDLSVDSRGAYDRLQKPDLLIHLGWGGLPNYESGHHCETELPRQYEFLEAVLEAGVSRLLVLGTCYEYGMRSGPLEERMPTDPVTAYGLAKDTLRRQLESACAGKDVSMVWGRLFYVWGAGQAESSLYSQLAAAANRGDALFNMSGGEQLRDFLPIERASDYIARLALAGGAQGIFNICSGQPVSVRKLVEQWIEDNNWQIKPNLGHYPYPAHEPMAFWGVAEKLEKALGDADVRGTRGRYDKSRDQAED